MSPLLADRLHVLVHVVAGHVESHVRAHHTSGAVSELALQLLLEVIPQKLFRFSEGDCDAAQHFLLVVPARTALLRLSIAASTARE